MDIPAAPEVAEAVAKMVAAICLSSKIGFSPVEVLPPLCLLAPRLEVPKLV